ncbi:phytase-like domain-containing protein [Favolaschia claudopus]|uniref:Phytase-like domain-containing protein n=1 Tax=Favolaschia claudopus TaxID=2862362 RepID=A0AAV9ZJ97_9AGAR
MLHRLPSLLALHVLAILQASGALSVPSPVQAASSPAVSVSLGGMTYVNKGLVGFGRIPSNFTESTGDTLGGIGTFTGTLIVQPDRGFNVETTVDYQARRHELDFVLTPYSDSTPLSFEQAQKTFVLTYKNTVLYFERNNTKTSGLDPSTIRAAMPGMPIASTREPHLSVDAEGLVANVDGTDEYGPYIYLFSAEWVSPILPEDKKGNINFTANADPKTGRAANQGFEGLTLDPATSTLYAILQSATIQDGGEDSIYTRLFAYDISSPTYLSLAGNGKVEATSEIHFLSEGTGTGMGGSGDNIKYKHIDLFSIANATDIHGTDFDSPSTPVAPKGKLSKKIVPATYLSFVDYADTTQLARFGCTMVGDPDDNTLLDAKWESLALAPVGDSAPNDFFLFTASDNDFLTTQGVSVGQPYNAGEDVDNQFLVFQVMLPGAAGNVKTVLGL